MIYSFFEELSTEIHNGITERGHPFRFITMATVGNETIARLRTVVLREVSEDLRLTIYTDSRTQKIKHITVNNQVSFLLYHPEKMLQLKVEGTTQIVTDTDRLSTTWQNIQPNSRKDYITETSPGSAIKNPDHVEYIEEENYFAILDIIPTKIEYLKLQRPNHIRALFTKTDDNWNGEFLVP
ncbi:pyridoxamine 5'-phosphate oxidase family protein [Maribacter hydrothermalis]|uniref:Pyridoxamine 5'-phosphate oxidase n=1 Tax=Maribacter hydrothermalis TaxID=1836467 RepID=A0A1B7ZBG7_9FLAO|nr:pyridoxamine 5'-phosphate oxidase family protein [Maribacter hydrothermalis]APQ16366.1 pyridoxamine 5'-phosphate oxidase [Maribacter hydrothermalis]OBR40065.1 pyridoxamine 5'-phosphate oxidase [Maribacter hydrothermalis]